ncbi:MAG: hypothetical protein WBW53_07570 [Terriglobales bacterium]
MSKSPEENEDQQAWRALSEAGLVEIGLDEFAERIKDVKSIVITRLRELLDFDSGMQERESAAYSLGTLKVLELKVVANSAAPPDAAEK